MPGTGREPPRRARPRLCEDREHATGPFTPSAVPEEFAVAGVDSPPKRFFNPHTIDEYRAVVISGGVRMAAIWIIPTAIRITDAPPRTVVIRWSVVIARVAKANTNR